MKEDWVECSFEDLLDYEQPTKYIVKSTEYHDSYKIPVLTAGKSFIKGYTKEKEGIFNDLPTIIFDDFTTASQFVNFKFKVKSSAMKILLPTCNLINMKFTYYCMQVNKQRSDTHKRYWISVYAKKKLFLPPLPIQRAIVSKIETLFSDLDKGIADLKKAQEQLKIYRQAVLKKAFEGELTRNKIEDDASINQNMKKNRGFSNLPESWKCVKFGDIAEMCLGKMLDKRKNKGESKPYLGNINVRWGNFDLTNLKKMKIEATEEKRYRIVKNDLIICEGGEPGRCAVWMSDKVMYIQKALHRVRVSSGNNPFYLYYYLKYLSQTDGLSSFFTGTTIKHLTGRRLKEVIIPLAPLQEQHQIVREIESRLSVCDKVEQNISEALEKSEALRQSILKKAFEGKMLSPAEIEACRREADYEPASALLERIRKEKKR